MGTTTIIVAMIIFTALISLIVEGLMYRQPISEKRIRDYQIVLDKKCYDVKNIYGANWKYDAKTEIKTKQRQIQSFVCLLATVLLMAFFVWSWSSVKPSFTSAVIACLCALILGGNGLVKWMLSWKVTMFILITIALLAGLLYFFIF